MTWMTWGTPSIPQPAWMADHKMTHSSHGWKKWVSPMTNWNQNIKCVAVMKYPTEMVSLLWFHIPFLQKKKPQLGLFASRRAEPDAKTTSWQVPGTNIEVVLLATSVTCHRTRPSRAYCRTGWVGKTWDMRSMCCLTFELLDEIKTVPSLFTLKYSREMIWF